MTDQAWNPLLRDQLDWLWADQLRDLYLHTHRPTRRETN